MKKRLMIIIFGLILVFNMVFQYSFADDMSEDEHFNWNFLKEEVSVAKMQSPKVDALAALIMDMESGRVLYEKNGYSQKSIASTTKIMTGIVAIENGNLNDMAVVSKRAAGIGGSTIDLKYGQQITLRDLLYGLMLKSGNDAAIAIAEHIGGTVEGFAELMNKKAVELGAKNTSFVSPHGLDAPGHHSTAYDLALITRYALSNPQFSEIVGTKSASISFRGLLNTNELLGVYPGADGVKTGYTGQAGRCLVTSVTRNNWRIISVVLGSPTRQARANSSKNILDYTFDNYKKYTLLNKNKLIKNLTVIKGRQQEVPIIAETTIKMPFREDEKEAIRVVIELPEALPAPVELGCEVGIIRYFLNDKEIASSVLRTGAEVQKKDIWDYLGQIFLEWQRIIREGV